MFVHFGAFLAISTLLALTPGPDTALVTRNALVGGRRAGAFTVLGIALGLLVWTVAASVGIAAILRASEPAFVAVKVVGSVYLVYLGAQALWGAIRGKGSRIELGPTGTHRIAPRVAFRQGLFCNLGNPKIAIFFTSFLPQFVHGGAVFLPLLMLGVTFALLTLCWLAAYSLLVGTSTALLNRPSVRNALDRFTGVVLIAFGVRLALERR